MIRIPNSEPFSSAMAKENAQICIWLKILFSTILNLFNKKKFCFRYFVESIQNWINLGLGPLYCIWKSFHSKAQFGYNKTPPSVYMMTRFYWVEATVGMGTISHVYKRSVLFIALSMTELWLRHFILMDVWYSGK